MSPGPLRTRAAATGGHRRGPGRRLLLGALSGAVAAAGLVATAAVAAQGPGASGFRLPPVGHVFVIVLENESYAATFGNPGADPYLAQTLPARGALLTDYDAIGHESNDNYVALVSGQPPNPANQSDCPVYGSFPVALRSAGGIEAGAGCVYPPDIPTVGNQLTDTGRNFKAYEEDMGNDPSRESAACGHPALGSVDQTQDAVPGDGYATRHDPFVYFHAVIDDQAYCDAHVVALGSAAGAMPATALPGETGLVQDLGSIATTPALSFITPNLCDDGHDYPCTNQASGPSALDDIDAFMATWVPIITSSPAFEHDGLLLITFDESDGPQGDSSSCCGETPGPASPEPGITGPGGGRVGAVVLSPFVRPGTVVATPYDHYSTLATIEQLFHLPRLGEAATVTTTFGPDVFDRP